MERHLTKLFGKARQCKVELLREHPIAREYRIGSPSGKAYEIEVYPSAVAPIGLCSCEWAQHRPFEFCSHVLAAYVDYLERDNPGYKVTRLWDDLTPAKRQHAKVRALGGGLYATLRRT
jgi:hypothetical protein